MMGSKRVLDWLAENAPDLRMIEVEESTATVDEAAAALGVEPARIAKSLTVRAGGETFLLVTRGDARLDNGKFKHALGARPRLVVTQVIEQLVPRSDRDTEDDMREPTTERGQDRG